MQLLKSRVVAVVIGALLVVALGAGGATAGQLIDSDDIRNRSVEKQDLARNSVGVYEIRPGGVRSHQLEDGKGVRLRDLAGWLRQRVLERSQGPRGPQGPAGSDGSDGSDGKNGVSGYEVVGRTADSVTLQGGESASITSACKSADQEVNDKVASAGGAQATSGSVTLNGSYPSGIEQVGESSEQDPAGLWAAKSWTVEVTAGPDGATVQPYVICQDNAEDD